MNNPSQPANDQSQQPDQSANTGATPVGENQSRTEQPGNQQTAEQQKPLTETETGTEESTEVNPQAKPDTKY